MGAALSNEETLMVPGKVYKPEDYLEIVWRRKWLAIVPFVIIAAATFAYTQYLPNEYRSFARVQVVPQQVPTDYVQPTVTSTLNDRLQAMSDQIQSRTRLERLMLEFNLYQEERQTMLMEDVVALMRRNVSVQIPRTRGRTQPTSFTVGFTSDNPRAAMQVTERLAGMFVAENLQDRAVLADQTSQFLETQLEGARRRLAEQEQKLEVFRRTYSGQLPSQVQTNLQVMQATQSQIQALIDGANRDHDRQLVLDKMISDLLAAAAAAPAAPPAGSTAPQVVPSQQRLAQARGALQALELRLTPDHPDVIRAKRVIRDLERQADAEALNVPLAPVATATASGLPAAERKRLADMQLEREVLERRIATNREKEAVLQASVPQYRARVEAAPSRETELTELTRDYETLREGYQALLARNEQARIAADLERRQIGQQFRIIDPAVLPTRPLNTKLRMNLMGSFAGLALGLALIGLFEYRDTSLRTDDDVTISLALPVLAVIPAMVTRRERLVSRRRRLVTAFSAAVVASVGAAAFVLWNLDVIRNWIP
jgi:polysaccharide chain length determinant protein (PEP-CTERM system associated)